MTTKKIYGLGKKVGLNKKEIDEIVQKESEEILTNKPKFLIKHPKDEYMPGTTYGTISIYNFH